jgi:hypothetical protein
MSLSLELPKCKPPAVNHFVNEPVARMFAANRKIGQAARFGKVHVTVPRHGAVGRPQAEPQIGAAVNAHARIVDGVAEQARGHRCFAGGECAS